MAQLLDPEFMSTLERMSLFSRKVFRGLLKGERRSKKKGISIEFADYRSYVPGDDLRFLDWNIYGRLDRLFLRLFQEEEDLNIYFLIDGSQSMDFGEPSKFLYARRLAAALGYIALVNLDRVAIGVFSSNLTHTFPLTRGKQSAWKLFQFLEDTPIGEHTDMETSFRSFALRFKGNGIVILLSDFMDPGGFAQACKFFSPRRHDVFAIQVLCKEEIEPPLVGDIRLLDAELEHHTDLSISASMLQRYHYVLRGFIEELRSICSKRDIFYLQTSNEIPFENLLMDYLRNIGLLK